MPSVDVNGVEIAYDVTGDGERTCILLHGFPDSAELWRYQVPALVDAGFTVVTPDLRGYGRSGKPVEVEEYSVLLLAGDVLGVLDHLGVDRAHVIGHDWGAAVAWALAAFVPDRVDHLVVLSVGAPGTFLQTNEQREKSWYMLLFQFADVAERWLSNDDWANFRGWARHPDADTVIRQLDANQSLTPALNYYRANIGAEAWVGPRPELPKVQAPTMGIWSSGDMALTEWQMTASSDAVSGAFRYERLDGPGHWMQLEAPDRVNALLVDFLAAG